VYSQPMMPWSSQPMWSTTTTTTTAAAPGDVRLGDAWDRRRTFGNVYTQPLVPRVPAGPGLSLHYGDPAGLTGF
jgi:hypothetical protein